jgi:hypothetical protein
MGLHRVVLIGAALGVFASHAMAQSAITWAESGIRGGERWREVSTAVIGEEAVRATVRTDGEREPFLGVEYDRVDGRLRIAMPDAAPEPIEVTAAQLEEMEASARRIAPELYEHPLRRGKLFRTTSVAEVAGVPCVVHVYRVEGAPERSMCMAAPEDVPLAPDELAAFERMARETARWGTAMKILTADRQGRTVDPAEHFDLTVFDQGFVMRAWAFEAGVETWRQEVLSIDRVEP